MKTAAVVQAAGKGSRFSSGQYKLLVQIDGRSMILRTLDNVLSAGFDETVVVIGAHSEAMRAVLNGLPVRIIENPAWEEGQSTSLAAGIRAVENSCDRACLLLGDQPYIRSETLAELMRAADEFTDEIIVPEYNGHRGNPIIVPAFLFGKLLELSTGDMGGRKLLQAIGYHSVPVNDPGILRDIDTETDLRNAGKEDSMEKTNFWRIEDGAAVPLLYGTSDIQGSAAFTPIGAYTTFRTYGRYGVLRLTKHLDRLEETSALAGHPVELDRACLKRVLTGLLEESSSGEKRIRVTVDLEKEIGTLYIAMEDLKTPAPQLYRDGIACRTIEAHRDNPKAKLSSFLETAENLRHSGEGSCDEYLMFAQDGRILEGLSSNFYGVIGNTVYTAEDGVLSGTTRDFILKIASSLEIPVVFRPVMLPEISTLDEAFISSTSRSVLPIRSIDGIVMRQGIPGPVTEALMKRFDQELKAAIEDLRDL